MRALVLSMSLLAIGCATAPPKADLDAAKALFDQNISAIQEKNRDAYLDCYLPTTELVRAGNSGVATGFADVEKETPPNGDTAWPSKLVATEINVHWLAPGWVYGTYRYEVTIEGVTTKGLSERVFRKVGDRWYVTVSTAFEDIAKPAADE